MGKMQDTLNDMVMKGKRKIPIFEVGDPVKLRGGNRIMVIDKAVAGDYDCIWFDDLGHAQYGRFRAEILQAH